MKKTSLSLFLLFSCLCIQAQTIITGTVKDKKKEAIYANVLFQSKESASIEGFDATDDNGRFTLNYKGKSDSLLITVMGMGIEKQQKMVASNIGQIDFIVEESYIQLKEVGVIPNKIRRIGDTLSYNVASYLQQGDRSIADILKKLPGIKVEASGQISYQGEAINKFYIENLDMLEGRYGIATNNITARDVASVQVLENHQPVKALQSTTYSEKAAINLKLKEDVKGIWTLNALLGGNYKPWGWEAELVAMYFGKGSQNMDVYKSNNVGINLGTEFASHYERERLYINPDGMLSVQEPTKPPVPLKRYLDNSSQAASVNYLSLLKDSLELVANVTYLYDHVKQKGYSLSQQYREEQDILWIEEYANTKLNAHRVESVLKLSTNRNNLFFNNYLNLKGRFRDMRGFTQTQSNDISSTEYISQKLHDPSYGLDNTLEVLKNIGQNTYNLYWAIAYTQKPSDLVVTPGTYWGIANLEDLKQELTSKVFATNIRTNYKRRINYLELSYALWARIDLENLNTQLIGKDSQGLPILQGDSLRNELQYNTYKVGLSQEYTYKRKKINLALTLPLYMYILHSNDKLLNRTNTTNKLIFNPSLRFNYSFTSEWKLGLNANYNRDLGGIDDAYSGYIMHNYRYFLRNTENKQLEKEGYGAYLRLSYGNAIRAFFINAEARYSHSKSNLLYGYNYEGILMIKNTIDQATKSDAYNMQVNASKGFNFWNTIIRLGGNYNRSKGEVLIDSDILNSRYQGYGYETSINIQPISKLGLTYKLAWNESHNYVEGKSGIFPKIRNVSQDGKVNFYPTDKLTFSFNIEHQYNSAASKRYSTFADIKAIFKYRHIDYELEYNNIFNRKQYISTVYNTVNTYFYSYNLRPASVLLKVRFKII